MAKASKSDIDTVRDFFATLEQAIEFDEFGNDGDGPDDDKWRRVGDLVWKLWPSVSVSYSRVVFGCEILIDNCCDPALSYLEWRPDVKAFLDGHKVAEEPTP